MRLVRITYNAITILDSILSIVEQNQWKKNYRAKHAKLAKASPTPLFFSNYILAAPSTWLRTYLAFTSSLLRTCFARDSIISYLFAVAKFKCVWLDLNMSESSSGSSAYRERISHERLARRLRSGVRIRSALPIILLSSRWSAIAADAYG
jgi:hypothetical protein